MFLTELSENKTLSDQLIGKMTPGGASSSGSQELDYQITRFLVAVVTKNLATGKWTAQCYGALVNKKSFLSTRKCLPLGERALLPSLKEYGFDKDYGFTVGEHIPPSVQWAYVSILVKMFHYICIICL